MHLFLFWKLPVCQNTQIGKISSILHSHCTKHKQISQFKIHTQFQFWIQFEQTRNWFGNGKWKQGGINSNSHCYSSLFHNVKYFSNKTTTYFFQNNSIISLKERKLTRILPPHAILEVNLNESPTYNYKIFSNKNAPKFFSIPKQQPSQFLWEK